MPIPNRTRNRNGRIRKKRSDAGKVRNKERKIVGEDETCYNCRLRSQCVKNTARKWCSRYKKIQCYEVKDLKEPIRDLKCLGTELTNEIMMIELNQSTQNKSDIEKLVDKYNTAIDILNEAQEKL